MIRLCLILEAVAQEHALAVDISAKADAAVYKDASLKFPIVYIRRLSDAADLIERAVFHMAETVCLISSPL